MNIQVLFKRDLENLSSVEVACIKQIAAETPAEFFRITQNFGEDIVNRLISDRRLVIRSGTRLTLYWDIFRDYILSERIPYIPVTYVPQANFSRYAKALAYMNGKRELTYRNLALEMSLGMGAADNLVRDLVNLGHVEANRKENRIFPLFSDEANAIDIGFTFWRSHEVLRRLSVGKPNGEEFTEEEFIEVYRATNKRTSLGEGTLHAYAQRMLRWLIGIGLMQQLGQVLRLSNMPRSAVQSFDALAAKRIKQSDFFLGEAPPTLVVSAFQAICRGLHGRQEINDKFGRNTCYALMKLGLMSPDGEPLLKARPELAESVVKSRARASSTVNYVASLSISGCSAEYIGSLVAERFHAQWSEGSKRRSGASLRQWAQWAAA